MANEVQIQSGLKLTNGNLSSPMLTNNYNADQTTARAYEDTQQIGTTAGGEVLVVGSISTAGWAYFKNLDATNIVKIGPESGGAIVDLITLAPGETAGPMKMATSTIRAIALVGGCDLWYRIYEA